MSLYCMVATAMAITMKDVMKDIMKEIARDLDGCVLTVGPVCRTRSMSKPGDLSCRFLGSCGELSCDAGDCG
jgi:hypothetical protein